MYDSPLVQTLEPSTLDTAMTTRYDAAVVVAVVSPYTKFTPVASQLKVVNGSDELQSARSVSFPEGLNSEVEAPRVVMERPSTTGGGSVGSDVGRPGVTVGLAVVGAGTGSELGARDGEAVGNRVG